MIARDQEIHLDMVACLDQGRTLFYYFKDKYCFDLIRYELIKQQRAWISITDLKRSRFSSFLQKETVKESFARLGSGKIFLSDLALCQPINQLPFNLTLAKWGNSQRGWGQTTRNQSNLVLQLNFSNQHKADFIQQVKPQNGERPFSSFCHPIRKDNRDTLAWARMDISMNTNEVLIEEIQNDWIRNAKRLARIVEIRRRRNQEYSPGNTRYDVACSAEELYFYVLKTLKPYEQIWAEAMLSATVNFIKEELGITNIYYHTFESGNKLKAVPGEPPRSIYTKLPKQFGFRVTNSSPEFILKDKFARRTTKAIGNVQWHHLEL